jgi:hypothetical protein
MYNPIIAQPSKVPTATILTDYHSYLSCLGTGVAGSLGNTTRSAVTSKNTVSGASLDFRGTRSRRYSLLSVAQDQAPQGHRVHSCHKVPVSKFANQGSSIRSITKSTDGRSSFSGVNSCGDVWACPVCTARIAQTRKLEIQHALKMHRKSGGIAVLVTFTFAHGRDDTLSSSLAAFSKALSYFKSLRPVKQARKQLGYSGQIRALETTHSYANGWHPHAHEIWLLDNSDLKASDITRLKDSIFYYWAKSCVKYGLKDPNYTHGLDIQFREKNGTDAVGAYLAKWGSELSYATTKKARGGLSPWQMLDMLAKEFDYKLLHLWREYLQAFKGKRQIYWSNGLKRKYGVDEVSDIEASDKPAKFHFMDITDQQWKAITICKAYAKVLDFSESHTPNDTVKFLDSLVEILAERARLGYLSRKIIRESTAAHNKRLGLASLS